MSMLGGTRLIRWIQVGLHPVGRRLATERSRATQGMRTAVPLLSEAAGGGGAYAESIWRLSSFPFPTTVPGKGTSIFPEVEAEASETSQRITGSASRGLIHRPV
jgi:hypothetical protein